MIYFIIDQEENLVSTKVLNDNIRKLENVISILSEPQGIALFYYVLTNLPEKYKCVTTILDKRKKVKYIRKILKYSFTFIVTVMTLAAAIIPIMTFYSSTPTTVDNTSAMTTKDWNITTTTTKNWNITTTMTTAVTTSGKLTSC